MMTRKNFEAVADVINANREAGTLDLVHPWIFESIALDLADVFADDNPNFDRDRFMKACGF